VTARILIVEDDDAHRATLARFLSRGYEVETVESAERALAVVARVDPDIVLTDVKMGEMSGFDLLRHLRELAPSLDVLLMTAYDDVQGVINAMKQGAYDYLVKPLDLERVEEVLARCVKDRVAQGKAKRKAARAAEPEYVAAHGLVGRDAKMMDIYKVIGAVATTRAPVLIRGETGTGKEMIARTIHENSTEARYPFVAINCTAIPETLLESELFGHVRGAFTGAANDRKGRFELAGSGTIFLDEIGDTSLAFQAKLLRVLQEREFYPVGSEQPRQTDARVLAATHRNIEALVREGKFREDLYFRLRVVEITVPPLRERRSDIPLLVRHILARVSKETGKTVQIVPDEVMGVLLAHDWPGNVRELENALTRAAVMSKGSALSLEHLSLGVRAEPQSAEAAGDSLDDVERAHVQRILAKTGGNKTKAAELLGVSRPRLNRIIEKYGLVVQ
jgi:two-component system response regulator AtoC